MVDLNCSIMLIAEIHGKRFPEAEGQEDWLTSAVFGHLRNITPGVFWSDLFGRAFAVSHGRTSLLSRIERAGISISDYSELEVFFWKSCGKYGEPDLILRFSGSKHVPLVVIIEVKLNSGKSGTGEDDQLKRYIELLDDPSALDGIWTPEQDHRYVVYLTRTPSRLEIEDSVRASVKVGKADAAERIFGLQWQDVLESASSHSGHPLLKELAEFLKVRGFEAFRGFRTSSLASEQFVGGFYGRRYFPSRGSVLKLDQRVGRFYGN